MDAALLKRAIELVTSTIDSPVFIQVKDNKLMVGGTNQLNGVVLYAPTASPDFFFVIPGIFAKQLTRILGKGAVKFEFEGDNIKVICGKAKMKIGCLPDNEMYENMVLKRYTEEESMRVNGSNLVAAINKVKHNANDKFINDAVLLGYHLKVKTDSIEVMTSNGRALALTSFPSMTGIKDTTLYVLNSRFETLLKLIEGDLKISVQENVMSIQSKIDDVYDAKIVTSLVSGKPREYEAIFSSILNQCVDEVHFHKKSLQEIVKIMEFFNEKEERLRVKFTFSSGGLTVSTSTGKGESENYIEYSKVVNLSRKDLTITLHPDIILKAIGSISSENVVVRFGDVKKPIHFSDNSVANLLTVFI